LAIESLFFDICPMRDFEQVLAYLYQRLPMYQRVGQQALKRYDLDKITQFSAAFGNPHQGIQFIHVAGTNGKGSVSSMLASVLMEAGYNRVGLYTSPHLQCFTERIRINGQPVPRSWVVDFVNTHQELIEELEPSFFECTCVMAFLYFQQQAVDWAVIEVGLGGRLDSTNIITPKLSVITSISYDHKEVLGDTLGLIAGEKAGIIKFQTPVVIGQDHPETRPVFTAKAAQMRAPIHFAPDHWTLERLLSTSAHLSTQSLRVWHQGKLSYADLQCDLTGAYQIQNIATVLESVEQLNALHQPNMKYINEQAILRGLSHVRRNSGLRGRMEYLQDKPLVIADVAHNPEGVAAVIAEVLALSFRQLHIIFGVVAEKDLNAVLALLPTFANYYFTQPNVPRALSVDKLAEQAVSYQLISSTYDEASTAYTAALQAADTEDVVLIIGSLFLVGELLPPVDE
jgi:dihydrofolate synthase / folylpolyglutamate synthase